MAPATGPDLNRIKHIVVVMMENRSFDHALGYLSLNKYGRSGVDGLRDDPTWTANVASVCEGINHLPWHCSDPFTGTLSDPPHERASIALQLGTKVNGVYPMNGFVTNYASVCPIKPGDQSAVMSYYTADENPVLGFLADNFRICDRWFCSLPAGTQPNRLMAMSGYSQIDVNTFPLPPQHLVYDWLNEHNISWRVYHEGMPFFAMMPNRIDDILFSDHFRRFDRLSKDLKSSLPKEVPQVLFMEPTYTDAPSFGSSSDDHPPTAVKGGQEFLLKVYNAISQVPSLWAGTVMIITYDEHGGFFDHVSPIPLITKPPTGADYPTFETSGVRVPAVIVSPFVEPRSVFKGNLDHTSILKFIAQVFGNGTYSAAVDGRQVESVGDTLNVSTPLNTSPPAPPNLIEYLARPIKAVGYVLGQAPYNELSGGFKDGWDRMQTRSSVKANAKFPDLTWGF